MLGMKSGMIRALLIGAMTALLAAGGGGASRTQAAPVRLPRGAVVSLAGTAHLWFADDDGTLHWGGDTRGIAGKAVDWGNRVEMTLAEIKAQRRGDPWLSAGLIKIGDPIYFVKWESADPAPRLLHILSIADVELFGINSANYGAMVMDQGPWETKFGFPVASLTRGELQAAESVKAGAVLLHDTFDSAASSVFREDLTQPFTLSRSFEGGAFVIRKGDPSSTISSAFNYLTGTFDDATIEVDVMHPNPVTSESAEVLCRTGYLFTVTTVGTYTLFRNTPTPFKTVVPVTASPAINKGTAWNHLELTCVGNTITGSVNGTQLFSVIDIPLGSGRLGIVAAGTGTRTWEARFDNLKVTKR
jgi:hypothetical protein